MLEELMKALGLSKDSQGTHPAEAALVPAAQTVPENPNDVRDWWERVQERSKAFDSKNAARVAAQQDPRNRGTNRSDASPAKIPVAYSNLGGSGSMYDQLINDLDPQVVPPTDGRYRTTNRSDVSPAEMPAAIDMNGGQADPRSPTYANKGFNLAQKMMSNGGAGSQTPYPVDPRSDKLLREMGVIPDPTEDSYTNQDYWAQNNNRIAIAQAEKEADIKARDDAYEAYAQPLRDQGFTPKLRMVWDKEQVNKTEVAFEKKYAAQEEESKVRYQRFIDNGGNPEDISLEDWVSTSPRRQAQFMLDVLDEGSVAAGGKKEFFTLKGLRTAEAMLNAPEESEPRNPESDFNQVPSVPSLDSEEIPNDLQGTHPAEISPELKADLDEKIQKDPSASVLLKKAAEVDIKNTTLTEDNLDEIDDLSRKVAEGFWDGNTLKSMMEGVGNFLGDRLEDPAMQNALIYYVGARLMGYTNSESGMAAGQVLQAEWGTAAKAKVTALELKNEREDKKLVADALKAKQDADRYSVVKKASDEAQAATDKALKKSRTPDMTKTTTMFDRRTNKTVTGNMAPNGTFYQSGRKDEAGNPIGVNSMEAGLVTYNASINQTQEVQHEDLKDTVSKTISSTLAGLDTELLHVKDARRLFEDGVAGNNMIQMVIRPLINSGRKVNTQSMKTALQNAIKKTIIKTATNGPSENGIVSNDLASMVQSSFIKADIRSEGVKIPNFVFGKPSSWKNGKPQAVTEDYEIDLVNKSALMNDVNKITSASMSALSEDLGEEDFEKLQKLRKRITPAKTLEKLSGIFMKNVMSDPTAASHWEERGSVDGTNAFVQWCTESLDKDISVDAKYRGFNSPEITEILKTMYK